MLSLFQDHTRVWSWRRAGRFCAFAGSFPRRVSRSHHPRALGECHDQDEQRHHTQRKHHGRRRPDPLPLRGRVGLLPTQLAPSQQSDAVRGGHLHDHLCLSRGTAYSRTVQYVRCRRGECSNGRDDASSLIFPADIKAQLARAIVVEKLLQSHFHPDFFFAFVLGKMDAVDDVKSADCIQHCVFGLPANFIYSEPISVVHCSLGRFE